MDSYNIPVPSGLWMSHSKDCKGVTQVDPGDSIMKLMSNSVANSTAIQLQQEPGVDVYLRKRIPFRETEGLSIAHLGESRAYFNKDGTLIWHMIDGERDANVIAEQLVAEHGCLAEEAKRSLRIKVAAFLADLHRRGLVWKLKVGVPEAFAGRLDNAKPAASDSFGSKIRAVQEFCATGQVTAGALDTIEKQLDSLYWQKHYIQKMHLELTYRCNFRCVHCYNTTHTGAESELTTQNWERILGELAGMGCFLLIFTGGELFVRKDALDVLQAACDRGFTFRLNTNGSLINEAALQRLETMRPFLQSVDISFYGATADMHDALARRPGSYNNTLKGVKLLREANFPLVSKYVTLRDNFDGIPLFEADMKNLGVRFVVHSGSVIPQTDRNAAPLVQLLTQEQYRELAETRSAGTHTEPQHCRPGHVRGAITPSGHVSPCEWLTDFKLGNLRERSLRDIWFGEEFLAFRRRFEQEAECPSCELRTGCERCPAHSYLETGDLLACAPIRRQNAEVVRDVRAAHAASC
jgi:radical SAM protein with 4Fe4S-binding SPASM domain